MEAHLNNFDYVVIGIMAMSCIFAFFRGLVREVLSLAAWIGAGIVTMVYFHSVAEKLTPHFKNPMMAAGIATVGIFLVALTCLGILNMIIVKSIKSGEEGGTLDNLLGLLFGAFRGALIISLGFFLITVALPEKEYPDWIKTAVTRPYVEKGALMLAAAAPNYLREISSLQQKAIHDIQDNAKKEPASGVPDNTANAPKDDTGYNQSTTRQLDRLIDSTSQTK